MRKKATAAGSGLSIKRILGVLVPLVIIVFLTLQQANFLLSRSLLIAFGDTESTYRSAWFEWDGDIVAKDVAILPTGDDDAYTLRFERVHMETPGWFWFLRNTFDRKLKHAKLDRIHITLSGGTSTSPFDPTLGDLGPFSLAVPSPFEAEGCLRNIAFQREELAGMGLTPGPTTLEFDYRVDGSKLATAIVLDTPGVSRVRYERDEQLGGPINALLIDQYATHARSERWVVEDQGFVKARNAWCAKRDRTTADDFLVRHLDSIERLLDIEGVGVDAASRVAYAAFARDGGSIAFDGRYITPMHSDTFYEDRGTGDMLAQLDATLERNGQRTALAWSRFDPIPLAGYEDSEDAVFALLQRERALQAPPPDDVMASATLGGAGARAAAPTVAARTPAVTTPQTTTVPAPTAVPVAAPAVAPTPATATPPPAAASAVATPPTVASTAAPPTGITLAWSDLARYKGQRMRIWTRQNPPRNVELLEVGSQQIRVQARLGGGHAQYSIGRDSFARAVLLP